MPARHPSAIQPDHFATFGQLLRFLRRRAGLTQRELSIGVGYSESQISRLEQNQRPPDEASLAARFVPALHLESEPEWTARLLELAAASRAEGEPETQAENDTPLPLHNLPIQLTSFVGREKELAVLKRLLAPQPGRPAAPIPVSAGSEDEVSARLVTLTGPGGTGKTRLALRVAANLLNVFPAGVWLVELAPLADPGLIAQTVAAVFALKEEAGRPLLATLTDYLRGKKALLILDNCEHLIQASAQFAEDLLRACPDLCILASSREILGVAGEQAFYVPSLSTPDTSVPISLETLKSSEAARLFAARAVAAASDFALTHANAPAVAQVCRQLDGIPLAIELAAARVKILGAEQIAERLTDRFQLLRGGTRTALPRHQTLQALMDWSYDLLSKPERLFLQRLAVFRGGWTLEAAEAVCAGDGLESGDVLGLSAQLVNKSLVMVERKLGGPPRYRLLETIREYALAKLEKGGGTEAARERHLEYYHELATAAEPHLVREEQAQWLEQLDVEHDNLRAALAWNLNRQDDRARALQLAGALWRFWMTRGYCIEGQQWLERALEMDKNASSAVQAKAYTGIGSLTWAQGNYRQATLWHEQALRLYEAVGDEPGIAFALNNLGLQAAYLGDYDRARPILEASLARYRQLADESGVPWALCSLGLNAAWQGDFERARAFFEEYLDISRRQGHKAALALALHNLGDVARYQGDNRRAGVLLTECLTLCRELGDKRLSAMTMNVLALIAWSAGDDDRATKLFEDTLALSQEISEKLIIAQSLEGLAIIMGAQGDPERAARVLGAAAALREAIGAGVPPIDRARHDENVAALRARLDADTFASAWAEGRAMTLEQAIAYALDERDL